MITVSNDFKTAMKQPIKEIQAYLDYGDDIIRDSDDLISFKISCDSGLCKTAMRKLEAKYLGNHNLLGKWVRAVYGVRLADGSFEFLDYGSFLVTELTVSKDTDTTTIVAYDKMINAMTTYTTLDIEYPVSLIDYTRVLCDSCGLELGDVVFKNKRIAEVAASYALNLTDALAGKPIEMLIKAYTPRGLTPDPISTQYDLRLYVTDGVLQNNVGDIVWSTGSLCGLPNGVCDTRGYGHKVQNVQCFAILTDKGDWGVESVRENTTLFYIKGLFDDMVETADNTNIHCTHFTAKQIYDTDESGVYLDGTTKTAYFSIPNLVGTTIDEIKAWWDANTFPVYIFYELAEPITTYIDDDFELEAGDNYCNMYFYTSCESPISIKYYQGTVNPMNDWQITRELWENIEGITYRDIFVQIAQATASTCIIGADDKVYFKFLTDTGESLSYDNMFKLKLENQYGEINSVALSRTPSEDNIYLQDEESVLANGLTEFKIENNEIIDKDRENAITPIFDALKGISYYPFEATTEGLGWYEIADSIDIINDAGEVFNTSLFNYAITIDGSIKETLKTSAETQTQTQYQYATSIAKRVKNTEVIVNKQDQYIQQLVSDMYEKNGVVNEKYTKIYQDIDNIINSVQNSGGNNFIKNSVMFAYDNNNIPANWEIGGGGTLIIQSDATALNNGGVSGHTFTLLDKTARQTVQVNRNNTYTFSTKIKKDAAGSCYVKLYNSLDSYTIELPNGTDAYYTDYEIKAVTPKENYFVIEFYGTADSNATFTDNMLSVGEYKSQWSQANGEVMNTQVNISIDGVTVKSSVYVGDYTVMSPLEFAGYSNINGTITRIFSLNKDVTEVEKLRAKTEVTMAPLKIVPITTGDLQGWAFVSSIEEA